MSRTPRSTPLVSFCFCTRSWLAGALPLSSVLSRLEEELGATRQEAVELRRLLDEVEAQKEVLADGVNAVHQMVEPLEPMRMDQLHTLPAIIYSRVTLGVRCGATALASV